MRRLSGHPQWVYYFILFNDRDDHQHDACKDDSTQCSSCVIHTLLGPLPAALVPCYGIVDIITISYHTCLFHALLSSSYRGQDNEFSPLMLP